MYRQVILYPNKSLKQITTEVVDFNDEIQQQTSDMLDTMYQYNGIGLAAPQIGLTNSVIVVDITGEWGKDPHILINPIILESSGQLTTEEGCLSLPTVFGDVTRPRFIKVQYQDLTGNILIMEAEGLLSTCIQHEIDHLKGTVFIDHLSSLKQERAKKKLQKLKKRHL
jgi:peptide deformylase